MSLRVILPCAAALLVAATGCDGRGPNEGTPRGHSAEGRAAPRSDGPAERAGEVVDQAVKDAGRAIEELGEGIQRHEGGVAPDKGDNRPQR